MVQCAYIAQAVTDYWNYGKVCCIVPKPIHFLEDDEIPQTFSNDFSALSPIEAGTVPFTIASIASTAGNATNNSTKDKDSDTDMIDEVPVDTKAGEVDEKISDSLKKNEDDQIKVEEADESKDESSNGDIENNDRGIVEEDEKSAEIGENDGSVDVIGKEKMEVDKDESKESAEKAISEAEIESNSLESDLKDVEEKVPSEEETAETKEIDDEESTGRESKDGQRDEKDATENKNDLSSIEKSSNGIKTIDIKTIDISKLLERPDPETEIVPKSLPEFSKEEFLRVRKEEVGVEPFKLFAQYEVFNTTEKTLLDNLRIYSAFEETELHNVIYSIK
ncbi:hypothetical protein B5S27_g3935 [[Candida] boidinii]|nr:hypothetical protein B5S27_g3935 [[Candida] boidinii]